MFRALVKWLLGASKDPGICWDEIDSLRVVTRESASDGYWRAAVEQVLCETAEADILFTRVAAGRQLATTTIPKPLHGEQAMIQRLQPDSPSSELRLSDASGQRATEIRARQTWLGLW